jgi:hypothetical protein
MDAMRTQPDGRPERHPSEAVLALTAIGDAGQHARRAPLTVVDSSISNEAQSQSSATGIQKKKKARRATGPLRRWTVEEDGLLQRLIDSLGEERPKRAQFELVAAELNTNRSGYAVEQHWYLYLSPGAPKAARAASDVNCEKQLAHAVQPLFTRALGEVELPTAPSHVAML